MEGKQDKAWQRAIACLPPARAAQLAMLDRQEQIEELRLRVGQPPAVKRFGEEAQLNMAPVAAEELRDTLSRAARYSVHSYAESLKHGFVTLSGGHRLGVCGTVAEENGQVIGVRGLSSLNLRVARQFGGLDAQIEPWLEAGAPQSTLLLSPPGFGKTTLLREWVRLVSDRGYTVAVADERGEIAALADGAPQFQVGRCTDVLEGCSKKQAALMLLKTMSPALLAFDEITAPEDVEAVSLCAHCGTTVLASAHAADVDDLRRRPLYRRLLGLGVFRRAVVIGRKGKERYYRMERLEERTCSS
nr:stage III sporulation protein AB [uncultured Agathobaculum sp.]